MGKKILILFTLLTFVLIAKISIASDLFDFEYDYSLFKTKDDKYILELYFSFYQKGLVYSKVDENFHAATTIDVEIQNVSDKHVIFNEMYGMPSVIPDTSGNALEQKLLGQINLQLNPGEYIIRVTGTDDNNKNNFHTIEKEITAGDNSKMISISDLQLASSIKKTENRESAFYKNTLEVIPNPELLFGNNLDKVYYYYEVYGLDQPTVSAPVTISSSIRDLNNKVLAETEKRISTTSAYLADFGSFPIDSLHSSSYILFVQIEDESGNLNLESEKKFFVYNSNIDFTNQVAEGGDEYLLSEYATMREELVDLDFEIALYIREPRESSMYRSLSSLDDKRKFMYQFWKKRDNIPETPQNEYKIEYLKRIQEANTLFNEPFKDGWRSERGRIYVVYGKPDVIDRFPFEHDKVGYEIWKYDHLEGGVICVFAEVHPSGSGIYDLIHSTIRGELRNDNWEAQLRR